MKRVFIIVVLLLTLALLCAACTTKDAGETNPDLPSAAAPDAPDITQPDASNLEPAQTTPQVPGTAAVNGATEPAGQTPGITENVDNTAFSGLEIEDGYTETVNGNVGFGGN